MKPKELLALSIVLITLMFVICDSNLAYAERVSSILPDRTLVVKEVTSTEVLRVKSVPEGITSAEQATSLVTGKLGKVTLKDSTGVTTSSFDLPCIKSQTTYGNKEVAYTAGWMTQYAPPSTILYNDYLLSIFWLWLPAILIMVISIIIIVWRDNIHRSLIFYTTLLAAVLVSAFVGGITGSTQVLILGIIIGGVGGGASAEFATEKPPIADSVMGSRGVGAVETTLGASAGVLTSMIAGFFAGAQNFKIVGWYLLFLIGVEAISFVISFAYAEQQRARAGLKAEIESETPDF